MAHHKSAKKRIRTSERKREINKNVISHVKTLVKKVYNAEDLTEAQSVYKEAVSSLDKNTAKGRIPKNTAARRKAALTKHLNSLTAAPAEEAK